MSDEDARPHRYIKLYFLKEDGQWEDQGNGYVHIIPDDYDYLLVIKSEILKDEEGKPKVVLTTRISHDDIYQQRQGTIVMWNDPWLEQEMALSFESASGCLRLWNEIQSIQGKPMSSAASDISLSDEAALDLKLPEPSISTLEDIHDLVVHPGAPRNAIASLCLLEGYLDKLFDVFEQCEDIEEVGSLHKLFDIFKSLVLFNHPALLRELFTDEHLMKLMGVLEYDPELISKQSHRQFLQHVVVFKELIALPPEVKQKIHQVHRVQYLKDTVLPRVLDDGVFATISGFIAQSQGDIIRSLYTDKTFLKQLFDRFDTETDEQRYCDLISFCQEMVALAKCLAASVKTEFYLTMCTHGLFNVIGNTLGHNSQKARLVAVDILWQSVHQQAGIIRGFMLSDEERARDSRFLRNMVMAVVQGTDESIKGQMVDVLKVLLDAGGGEDKVAELNEFLHLFYGGTPSMVELLSNAVLHPQPHQISTQYHVLELLASCVNAHTYRIKRFIMQSNLIGRVLALLKPENPTHLQCAVIRFIKAVVVRQNLEYNALIVKQNYFAPLVELFISNGPLKYNLVNSAILSIFEFIRRENVKVLLCYTVEQFGGLFDYSEKLETFAEMKVKYEQHRHRDLERTGGLMADEKPTTGPMTAAPYHDLRDDEDEDYFNTEAPEPEEPSVLESHTALCKPMVVAEEPDEGLCPLLSRTRDKPLVRPIRKTQEPQRPLKVRRLESGGLSTAPDEDGDEGMWREKGEEDLR